MSSTCVICTSGTRHMPSSHHGHLLIIPSCYAITFFNICFCIILNTYFLTDCLPALYFIILLLFYPDMCPSFFTLLLAYHKPGEGRVLSRTHIRDSYPWLRSETYEISDRSIKLNNEYWSFSHTFPFRHIHIVLSSITPSLHSLRGPVDSFSLV